MKQLLFLFLSLFVVTVAHAQFADSAALNQYIIENIRDKRPEKVTADQLQRALLGVSSLLGQYGSGSGGGGSDSSASQKYVGKVYDKTNWADLSDFSVNTLGATVSGGKIHIPDAGVTDFTKSLQLADFSCVNHWKVEFIFTLDEPISSSTTGLSIGIQSANNDALCSWAVYLRAADAGHGEMEFFSESNGGGWVSNDAASGALDFAEGDSVKVSIERVNNLVYLRGQNLSNPEANPIYYEIKTAFNSNPVAPNTGHFAVWGQGGAYTIERFTVYNNEVKEPDVMLVGDSKTLGYGATSFYKTVPGILGRRYKNVAIGAGFGDKTIDVVNRLPEIIKVHPKQVLLNIGCNDLRFGGETTTAIQNIDTIVDRLTRAGIEVRLITPSYEGGLDMSEMYSGIVSHYPNAIDVFSLFRSYENLYTDAIHWNDKGNELVASLVIDSNALAGVKTDQDFTDLTPVNVYNTNGTLTGDRTMDLGGHHFQIYGLHDNNEFNLDAWDSNFRVTGRYQYGNETRFTAVSDLTLAGGQSALTSGGFNYESKFFTDTTSSFLNNYQLLRRIGPYIFYTIKNFGLDTSGVLFTKQTESGNFGSTLDTLFRIDTLGNTSTGKITSVQPTDALFRRYFVLGNKMADTTRQLWSMGIQGVPGSSGPNVIGGELHFRSYNNTGAVLATPLRITRGGAVYVPNTFQVGATPTNALFSGSSVARVVAIDGSVGITGGFVASDGISFRGPLHEGLTTTVTGDYTVVNADLYVNVDNSTNCTITIPGAGLNPTARRKLIIKKISNNTATVTLVVAGGTQNIEGNTSYVIDPVAIPSLYPGVTLKEDGSNWWIYGKY